MREPICPICHERGWYPVKGERVVFCDCPQGQAGAAIQKARNRLSVIYTVRETENWLQSRMAAFGGERPLRLLQSGRSEEVLSAIERLVCPI